MTAVHEKDADKNDMASQPVEIATLVVPSSTLPAATHHGASSSSTANDREPTRSDHPPTVLLEGSSDLMHHLTLGHSASDPEINAQIEAVVDLETICELAHEDDIVAFMVETQHQHHMKEETAPKERPVQTSSEAQPLLAASSSTTRTYTSEQQPSTTVEKGALPAPSSLLLSAEPFVETLAHVHQENNMPNEAFLLSVPEDIIEDLEQQGDNHHPHRKEFILALPEIIATKEQRGKTTQQHEHAMGVEEEELDDTTYGIMPFMQRALSELPSDVQAVEIRATATTTSSPEDTTTSTSDAADQDDHRIPGGKITGEPDTTIQLDLVIERKVPVIGFILLIAGLFSLASVGAALGLQGGGVGPLMKSFWRLQATSICMFPLAARNLTWKELNKLTLAEWGFFVLCSFSYLYSTTAFVEALQMTTLANTFVLTNLTSINIIFSKAIRGIPVLLLEGLGAVVGISGAIICTLASSTGTTRPAAIHQHRTLQESFENNDVALWGDLLAYSGSIASAVYLILAKTIRAKMDLFVFMWALFTLSSFFALFYMVCLGGEPDVTFDRHPVTGIFGWLHLVPDRFPLTLWLAIVCNIVGTTGFVAVLKYFEPVVVSMVMLAVPVVAAFEGAAAGVAALPGIQTWIGDAIVMIGSTMVILSGTKKTEHIDATKAVVLDPISKKNPEEAHPAILMKSPTLLKNPSARWQGGMETIPERNGGHSRGGSYRN